MLEKLSNKFSPTVVALLALPALLIVSLPFSFISGVLGIIVTDNVMVGWGVGSTMALIFATWAGYGTYKLANEVQEEPGAESVTA